MITKKSTSPRAILFHIPKDNAEEALKNQQAFEKQYEEQLTNAKIISYTNSESDRFCEVRHEIDLAIQRQSPELSIIIPSPIPLYQWDIQYNSYSHYNFLEILGIAKFHHMDSEGRLFRRVRSIY